MFFIMEKKMFHNAPTLNISFNMIFLVESNVKSLKLQISNSTIEFCLWSSFAYIALKIVVIFSLNRKTILT